jgi:hypothetical protein
LAIEFKVSMEQTRRKMACTYAPFIDVNCGYDDIWIVQSVTKLLYL